MKKRSRPNSLIDEIDYAILSNLKLEKLKIMAIVEKTNTPHKTIKVHLEKLKRMECIILDESFKGRTIIVRITRKGKQIVHILKKVGGGNFTQNPTDSGLHSQTPLIHANRETSAEVSPNSNPSDLNSRGNPTDSSPSFPLRESRLA